MVPAFGLPAINTVDPADQRLTVTMAHHALRAGHRGALKFWLALTFLLGFTFVGLQAHEYGEAYRELGLRLSTGIYGSTFFMLTGFHGLHVTIGAIMLTVIWFRVRCEGHFTPNQHFAFEAVAWYWHFVDVVWLGLFISSTGCEPSRHADWLKPARRAHCRAAGDSRLRRGILGRSHLRRARPGRSHLLDHAAAAPQRPVAAIYNF